ncbi:MAG: hypothetical protein EBS01_01345 [Verrucomicrobia bacterium]|nr:hypothetical protein [Verrucomicrobiota bacterium]
MKSAARIFIALVLIPFTTVSSPGTPPPEAQAQAHFSRITAALAPTMSAEIADCRPLLVEQMPGQLFDTKMPPVWVVHIPNGEKNGGYVMWESAENAALLEFALEGRHVPLPRHGAVLADSPALQQFPVLGKGATPVASGCVPTSGAGLVGYWAAHGMPQWLQNLPAGSRETLQECTLRLRQKIRMQEFPDTCGYTEEGMPLSGAYPQELSSAIKKDAAEHGVSIATTFEAFAFDRLKNEINAACPVLLSCTVRLPHKPHLSWGHAVLGVGWLELEDSKFVGIKDNFYPTASEDTIRWIREDAFTSLITVHPNAGGDRKTAELQPLHALREPPHALSGQSLEK